LDSTPESIDRAECEALEMATRSGLQENVVGNIGLAVREIMTNAIIHGNGCDPHKKVLLTISRTPDKLKIAIADEGEGFDVDRLPDPLSPEGLLKGSGRGVYLARAFMDELLVQRDPAGWTTVSMAKVIESAS
jgi:serine/threonine-protein kinase RsbW